MPVTNKMDSIMFRNIITYSKCFIFSRFCSKFVHESFLEETIINTRYLLLRDSLTQSLCKINLHVLHAQIVTHAFSISFQPKKNNNNTKPVMF